MSSYMEILWRSTFAFLTLFLLAKFIGKKLISQMTFFDYIAGISIGNLSANLAIDHSKSVGPILLALLLWSAYTVLLDILSLKSRRARKFIEGRPTLLIQNGKIMEGNLKKIRFSVDDLLMVLRQKNIFNIADVEFALLEQDGKASVLPKSQKRPVTPNDLKIHTPYEGLPSELIVDGKIIYKNLEYNKLDIQWLKDQLEMRKIARVEDVFLAQLMSNGKLYIDVKGDQLQYSNGPTDGLE